MDFLLVCFKMCVLRPRPSVRISIFIPIAGYQKYHHFLDIFTVLEEPKGPDATHSEIHEWCVIHIGMNDDLFPGVSEESARAASLPMLLLDDGQTRQFAERS